MYKAPLTRIVGSRLHATRYGLAVRKWTDVITPGAGPVVLTTGVAFNIPRGKRILLTQVTFGVNTDNKNCGAEIVETDQPDGAGAVTVLSRKFHIFTGASKTGLLEKRYEFDVPIVSRYATGARCLTIRVDAVDASTDISVGWTGILEDDS